MKLHALLGLDPGVRARPLAPPGLRSLSLGLTDCGPETPAPLLSWDVSPGPVWVLWRGPCAQEGRGTPLGLKGRAWESTACLTTRVSGDGGEPGNHNSGVFRRLIYAT